MAKRTISASRVIVTGASGGIGREIALELGERSADVVLLARREDRLRELVEQFKTLPGRAEYVVGDVTDHATRRAVLERAREAFGGLDILVNNAGVGGVGRFEDANPERLRRIMELNFFAAVEMIRLALPALHNGKHPMVVNVGSILGRRGVPLTSEYCASKFALQGFSESLRAELSASGIDVLMVNPGTTGTEFSEHVIGRTASTRWPEHRGVSAADVARAAVSAMQAGRSEIIPNMRGRLLCWLNRLSPRLVDRLMRKYA